MEYIAAALEARGHAVTLADLALQPFARAPAARGQARACRHRGHARARDRRSAGARARRCAQLAPGVPIVVGGHTAAAYPGPFLDGCVDAVVLDDGERAMPRIARCARARRLARRRARPRAPRSDRRGGHDRCRSRDVRRSTTCRCRRDATWRRWRRQYACLAHRPAWLIETARGCPFRCSFCSIWQLHADRCASDRSTRCADDFASVGDHIFVADDLFWYHPSRSLALAHELRRRGIRKDWMLVQSRVDLVARHAELLEAWRPIAREFDIFFGLEAATNAGAQRPDEGRDRRSHGARASTSRDRWATASPATSSSIRRGARRTSSGCGRSSSSTGCSRPASRS